jgi:hypothetical protein
MFKKNKWEAWWDSLSPQMKTYLQNQPVWHDRDLYKAMAWGGLLGFLLGLVVGYG